MAIDTGTAIVIGLATIGTGAALYVAFRKPTPAPAPKQPAPYQPPAQQPPQGGYDNGPQWLAASGQFINGLGNAAGQIVDSLGDAGVI